MSIKEQVGNLLNSFKIGGGGWSGRKLSAFAAIVIAAYFGLRYGSENNVVELTIIWLSFALLCLGIVTFEQIIKLKNGDKIKQDDTNE